MTSEKRENRLKVAVASFVFEGNSLSPRIARREDFARWGILQGQEMLDAAAGEDTALAGGIEKLQNTGAEVVPIFASRCVSGGYVEDSFFDEASERIVEGIVKNMPLDGIYLALHGAMICATEKDPEGAILAAIRARIGSDVPIAVSLDLHAHVTTRMADNAQIIVGYETYPHDDAHRTGSCAAGLLIRAMRGEISPITRIRKFNAIVPVLGGATHGNRPMAHVAAHARQLERNGHALSVSYFPVQPWLDMPDVGITGLAVTDSNAQQANAVAQEILEEIWKRRREFELPAMTPDEAVQSALKADGRVLIVDAPDSMGAGATGDSPAILAALLTFAPDAYATLFIVDATASQYAHTLGEGVEGEFRIGASIDQRWFKPVRVKATVERLCDGRFQYKGGPASGAWGHMGPTAVLRAGNLRILVGSHAFYEHMDEHYAACGVNIVDYKIACFKNLMNYRKLLGDGVSHLILHGPGSSPLRLQDVDWENRQRPYWPADDVDPPLMLS